MVWAIKIILVLVGIWQVLRQTYWWQIKEYRWDRWLTWIKYNQGWQDSIKIDIRVPKWTFRSILVTLTGLVGVLVGGGWAPITGIGGVILGVIWTYPVMEWQRTRIMAKAKRLVDKYQPKVVTVNGSYGKSSSKDFLVQVLESKFRVVYTKGSENSELGVARRIIKDLDKETEVLVLELGAYKRGEIARMCQMVTPEIALVTGIGPQHIDLFGNLENSQKAEFETIEALSETGVGIFNGDSPDESPLIEWAKKRIIKVQIYSTKGKIGRVTTEGFELEKIWVPVRGVHFAENILGVMAVARELGMTEKEIIAKIKNLKQPEKSLKMYQLKCGAMLIDNSYNTNKEGFMASVNYLKLFQGRRFVITPGIIELGDKTYSIHVELGQQLKNLDGVWVSRPGVETALKEGGATTLTNKVEEVLQSGDTLLIEGRIAPSIKERIMQL